MMRTAAIAAVLFLATAVSGDDFTSQKSLETLSGTFKGMHQLDDRDHYIVQLADGSVRMLPAEEWSRNERAAAEIPAAPAEPKAEPVSPVPAVSRPLTAAEFSRRMADYGKPLPSNETELQREQSEARHKAILPVNERIELPATVLEVSSSGMVRAIWVGPRWERTELPRWYKEVGGIPIQNGMMAAETARLRFSADPGLAASLNKGQTIKVTGTMKSLSVDNANCVAGGWAAVVELTEATFKNIATLPAPASVAGPKSSGTAGRPADNRPAPIRTGIR